MAHETGLTIDTLRYYERIGLLVNIERNSSGHRCYSSSDLTWLRLLICLRETGMPIADMQRFATLIRGGDETVSERLVLLKNHRQNVLGKIAQMHKMLAGVEEKINHYSALEQVR